MVNEPLKYFSDDYIKKNIIIKIKDNVKSFSEMVNSCIKECKTEIFIFLSHRVSPREEDIRRIVDLISKGYGYVGLYRFGCFGLHMDVIKKIGYFDENYIRGGYEDDDFRIRLMNGNIGYYEDHSVEYRPGLSTFESITAFEYFNKKYSIDEENKIITINIKDKIENNPNEKYKDFLDNSNNVDIINFWTFFSKKKLYLYKIKYSENL
jgi:hypothetical protein